MFITRADLQYDPNEQGLTLNEQGLIKFANWVPCNKEQAAGKLIWRGRGITRILYGKMDAETANSAKVKQGIAKHAEVESGQATSVPALAVQGYIRQLAEQGYACYKEVFLAGEIANKSVLGYADCIACHSEGHAKLIDWKFSEAPDKIVSVPKMHHNYAITLVGYAFLVYAMYGAKMSQIELAAIHAETGEIHTKTWHKGDLAQYWLELTQRLAEAKAI